MTETTPRGLTVERLLTLLRDVCEATEEAEEPYGVSLYTTIREVVVELEELPPSFRDRLDQAMVRVRT